LTEDSNLFGEPLPLLGAPPFREAWGNRKAFYIGLYVGKGYSTTAIVNKLNDGLTRSALTGMVTQWGYTITEGKRTHAPVKVMLSGRDRTLIATEGGRRGVDISELCRQVLVNVARDEMWKAVLDL
jgi:hypothetical protein